MSCSLYKTAFVTLCAVLLASCSSVSLNNPETNPGTKPPETNTGTNPSSVPTSSTGNLYEGFSAEDLWENNASALFFFEFNRYEVALEDYPRIKAYAAYLKAHPAVQIRIAGHTDDVGGSEYNLALGQKRSEAVERLLSSFGAAENQIEAISYGKEKPLAFGNDESSRAQNRRAHIIQHQF